MAERGKMWQVWWSEPLDLARFHTIKCHWDEMHIWPTMKDLELWTSTDERYVELEE